MTAEFADFNSRSATTHASPASVFALDLTLAKGCARQHRRVGVTLRRVGEVPVVVRQTKDLPASGAEPAHAHAQPILARGGCRPAGGLGQPRSAVAPGFHAGVPPTPASGGISCAVGLAWRNACRQIFSAKKHIATTRSTKKAHTTASR